MRIFSIIFFFLFILFVPNSVFAWGLKTHIWLSQAILNDALDDGAFSILGRNYPLPAETLNALRSHPDAFRMGNIGPDAIPDPVVGQTTTHPGVENEWQTDDWLNHLLLNSDSPDELAMALGFIAHASGDVFAHTYVNAYAGDVFSLTDDEVDVERRHFVLEKYIEGRTPVPKLGNGSVLNWGNGLSTPREGMRDLLIYNEHAASQNLKAGTGVHLYAMRSVRRAVENINNESQKLIEKVTKWVAKYYKLQAKLLLELEPAKLTLEQARLALELQEELLKIEEAAHRAALSALRKANEIVQKNPELITANEQLLAVQIKAAADALVLSSKVVAEVNNIVSKFTNEVRRITSDIERFSCNRHLRSKNRRNCRNRKSQAEEERRRFFNRITGARERQDVVQAATRAAEKVRDETRRYVDRLKRELENAATGLADGTYAAAVTASKLKLDVQRDVVAEAKKIHAEVERIHGELTDELDIVNKIIDEVKEAVDRYNAITLLADNWRDGIDKATTAYIGVSHEVGRDILTNSGDPLARYKDWYDCYGTAFVGVPVQIGEIGCEARNFVEDLNSKFDEAINELPEVLQWILFPTKSAKKEVLKELEPHLDEAKYELVEFITNENTADFIRLLSNPENATRAKLQSVFAEDGSGKNLIVFNSVADLVDADLNLRADGTLDPEQFVPLKHALMLAKISLLGPDGLNRLVRDQVGADYTSIYGRDVFPTGVRRFSALIDAVKNIDGNHQWQAYGLPHPKRLGSAHSGPEKGQYGHDFSKQSGTGFRFWVDPYLREKVFMRLFPEPVMGSLNKKAETRWKHYMFPECAANPFPATQNRKGTILTSDPTCAQVSDPNRPPVMTAIATPEEYEDIFYHCQKLNTGRYWAMVGAYKSKKAALRFAHSIESKYPDLSVKVWRQSGKSSRRVLWIATMAACADKDSADTAVATAKRRGIALDAYTWSEIPFATAD